MSLGQMKGIVLRCNKLWSEVRLAYHLIRKFGQKMEDFRIGELCYEFRPATRKGKSKRVGAIVQLVVGQKEAQWCESGPRTSEAHVVLLTVEG